MCGVLVQVVVVIVEVGLNIEYVVMDVDLECLFMLFCFIIQVVYCNYLVSVMCGMCYILEVICIVWEWGNEV